MVKSGEKLEKVGKSGEKWGKVGKKFVRSKHVVITEVHRAYTKNTKVARR